MRFIISPAKQMKIDTDSFVCTELPVFTDRAEIQSRSKRLTGVAIILTKTALPLTNMFLSGQKYPGSHLGGDYI